MSPLHWVRDRDVTAPSPAAGAFAIVRAMAAAAPGHPVVAYVSLGFGYVSVVHSGPAAISAIHHPISNCAATFARGTVLLSWADGVNPFCSHAADDSASRFVKAVLGASRKTIGAGISKLTWLANDPHCHHDASQEEANAPAVERRSYEHVAKWSLLPSRSGVTVITKDAFGKFGAADPFLIPARVARRLGKSTIGVAVFGSVGIRGEAIAVMSTDVPQEPRMTYPGVSEIRRAVSAMPEGTIVALWLEDLSCFCTHSPSRERALSVTATYPALWIATFNPCVINATTGAISPREIPIPPFDMYSADDQFLAPFRTIGAIAIELKPQLVRWRGVSTGIPWRESQRYRALKRISEINHEMGRVDGPRSIDVGVSMAVQGVSEDGIPLRAERLSEHDMAMAQVQLDLDGNANAWRGGMWKLFVGSAVLKAQGEFIEWHYRHMVNGTHVLWFETPEEMAEAAVRLVRPPQSLETLSLLKRLAKGAREIGERYLSPHAIRESTEARVRCAASEYEPTKDWRMRRG